MNRIRTILTVAVVLLLAAGSKLQADSIIGEHDWSDGAEGWESFYGLVGLDDGAANEWLRISFPAINDQNDPTEFYDIVRTDASSLFAGSWDAGMWVEFDFWAEDVEPEAIYVAFGSSDDDYWYNPVFDNSSDSMDTGLWNHFRTDSFVYDSWLYDGGPFGTEQQFLDDLAAIDWIGLYIRRGSGLGEQHYRIDNFQLWIPEPSEWVLLIAAAFAVMIAMRRREMAGWGFVTTKNAENT